MSNKLSIETKVRRLIFYIQDIEKGLLQIPPFQRDKAWDNNKRKDLFDSLKNGYPIGSILLWKPAENIFDKSIEKIGPYTVNSESINDFFYILDGFQRLSTLFGCLIDPNKTKLTVDKTEWQKEFFICYDLEKEEFFIPRTPNIELYQVPTYKLIDTRAAFELERELHKQNYSEEQIEKYRDRYENLGTILIDYSLPSTLIVGGEVEDAVDIFSRVNSRGSIISPDWMVSALSYNKDKKHFTLASEIDNLLEELTIYNFEGLKRELILQCIVNSFGKVHFDQMNKKDTRKIELLVKRPEFVETCKNTLENIKKAVQFLFEELLVIDSKLLPYGNQLVFITDFFNQVVNPTETHIQKLKDWFWITTYASYFTIYALSKQREAYYQFQKFIADETENPVYNDKPDLPFDVTEFPNKIFFGSVRAKALLLFMLNYANDFQKVDAFEVERLNLNYLFYDVKDEKGNFPPESAVPIMEMIQSKFPKTKDMSFLLKEYNEGYEKYFLSKEMYFIFNSLEKDDTKNQILYIRKHLIKEVERAFVKKLGLNYDDTRFTSIITGITIIP